MQSAISKATLGRLPAYLHYLENITSENISAPAIARALGLGEVLVRKDLSLVCGKGKPKTGYDTDALTASLKAALGVNKVTVTCPVSLFILWISCGGFVRCTTSKSA